MATATKAPRALVRRLKASATLDCSTETWNRYTLVRDYDDKLPYCCRKVMTPTPSGFLVCLACDSRLRRIDVETWRWAMAYALGLSYPRKLKPETVDRFVRRYERRVADAREWAEAHGLAIS